MRVLILGGTGFIGSALARELMERGHEVVVSSRQPTKVKYREVKDDVPNRGTLNIDRDVEGGALSSQQGATARSSVAQSGSSYVTERTDRGMRRMEQALRQSSVGNAGISLPPDDLKVARQHVRQGIEEPLEAYGRQDAVIRDLVEAASTGERLSEEFWVTTERLGMTARETMPEGKKKNSVPEYVIWDGRQALPLMSILDKVDAVVNLVGEYLGGR